MARIIPFCSSSKGNSVLIELPHQNILVDIGCSYRALNGYLNGCDIEMCSIAALLITHEHTDHVGGLPMWLKHSNVPVFASRGTVLAMIDKKLLTAPQADKIRDVSLLRELSFDGEIDWFHTSHDSRESVGYTITTVEHKIGYCTDSGRVTDEMRSAMLGADMVFLESNYDLQMMNANTNYPFYVKKRIQSDNGHLSNSASAEFSAELVRNGTEKITLGHLSPENNTKELAYQCTTRLLQFSGAECGRDYLLNVAEISLPKVAVR